MAVVAGDRHVNVGKGCSKLVRKLMNRIPTTDEREGQSERIQCKDE